MALLGIDDEDDDDAFISGKQGAVETFAARLTQASGIIFDRTLKKALRESVVVVVTVPAGWESAIAEHVAEELAPPNAINADHERISDVEGTDTPKLTKHHRCVSYIWVEVKTTVRGEERSVKPTLDWLPTVLAKGVSVLLYTSAPAVLPSIAIAAADARLDAGTFTSDIVDGAVRKLTGARGQRLSEKDCRFITPDALRLAWRPKMKADVFTSRLARIIRTLTPKLEHGPGLAALAGMDEAKEWGRGLARDLAVFRSGKLAWSEVDRGLLLSGPPGCGKTVFAKALAQECKVPLIIGSLPEWQASREGYLGDLLAAMRACFDQARAAAPCVMFIDELDSFGDRTKFPERHRDYSTQVVNGFLELLDGIQGREGVVVISACNHPDRIDPAIVRSGRIEKRIDISMPDLEQLADIFRLYGAPNPNEAACIAVGASGADVERWCRVARRRARDEARELTADDVLSEISGQDNRTPTELRTHAVHECGHALVSELRWPGSVKAVSVRRGNGIAGFVLTENQSFAVAGIEVLKSEICKMLAGRAAEVMLLGSPTAGSGGSEESDLASATMLSITALLQFGLSGNRAMLWAPAPDASELNTFLRTRPDIANAAQALLDECWVSVSDLLRTNTVTLERMVDRLVAAGGVLTGQQVAELVRPTVTEDAEVVQEHRPPRT